MHYPMPTMYRLPFHLPGRAFTWTGPLSGRTFVYQSLFARLRSHDLIVICVVSTGVAAQLLLGGQTSHSRFKIPVPTMEDSMCHVPPNSYTAELLRKADMLIWDKVSMQHRYCFEAVDRTLRYIRQADELFGGLPAAPGGDWARTLPVARNGLQRRHIQRVPASLACMEVSQEVELDEEHAGG
ncbi:hypothetical protein VTN49DRAFT_2726 [Thermomyces lanuginosus]|uniref:uncharacterized protein n=1 Tax=Thermomyces lanuginosus TaxID=5541 RepID=UPI0037442848